MNKLISLQYGRAIAALAVVFYHFSGYHQANQGFEPFGGFFKFGHLGVDFFFVLSGFVIMMAHKKDLGQSSKIVSFSLKRFFRIFPTYWLHLSFIILVRISAGILLHQDSFYRDFDFSFMLDNFLLLPTGKYLIGPAWSLSYELFSICYFHQDLFFLERYSFFYYSYILDCLRPIFRWDFRLLLIMWLNFSWESQDLPYLIGIF